MKFRKLIALLAALMLMITSVVAAIPVSAEMGGDFPWTDASEKMLIEEILERDGFIDGIWMPWFNEGQTGHNLTGNDLMADYYNSSSSKNWDRVELDYYGADKIYREIYNLKAMGYNIMAYGGSIFGEGVIFDANGDVIGIKEEYLNNARRLLNMCREIGMPVMWNVYFHDSSMPSYYGMEGWHVICQMLGNPTVADHYAERFVRPLCEMLAEYPDVVAMVSIADEPENQINDMGKGDHWDTKGREMYGVNQDDMIYFMQQINEVVREELPNVARTVASNNGNKTIYRDFDLDIVGHNQYTDGDTFKSVESLLTNADVILSEYNVGTRINDDTQYANKLITFREWMMANGYKGGFQWCWTPGQYSGAYALQRSSTGTAFRKTVALLRYYIDEYRAEYRGETITLDAPVLYANAGDGKVLFIPSKRATKITVQRSDDGGSTWTNLVTKATQSTYVDQYLVGTYTDSTSRPSSGYCYRIIAYDDAGNSVTSEPNDLAGTDKSFKKTYTSPSYSKGKYYITSSLKQADAKLTSFGVVNNRPLSEAANLIQNGSFESTGGQWNNSEFLQYASVVSDSTTPDGNKSLYFDTSAQSNEGWYKFTVDGLKANTEYTFSAFIKGGYLADDNKGQASIGVMDPDQGHYMFYWEYFRSYPRASRPTKQMYPTAYDNEWHIRSVTFNSGDMGSVEIALYGYSTKMWVDGMALFETSKGMKYETGESAKAIASTEYNPASGATNAVTDPNVNNASYWNTGAGYKQGFMSVTGGKLKYTASSAKAGVRYTKWIDVKPGTDYYYSYTVNVTTAGNGYVALTDNAMLLPNDVVKTTFSSTGTKTVTGRISTGAYDQLGLAVVDLGGVATIDNIYLYEGEASTVLPTNPSYDGYIINGDFEIGASTNWENLWNNNTVEMVAGYNSSFAMKGTAGGSYTQVRQKITVEPNTDYIIEVWAKNVSGTTLIVKDSTDSNLKQTALQGSGSTWTKTTLEFNSGSHEFVYLGFMGSSAGKTWTVDNVTMKKKVTESNDGYIVNGDLETGVTSPWENVWGSSTVNITTGYNSSYGMKVNTGLYNVVRQKVAVEKNTDYVIELWVKDATNANLLVKDNADSTNILNKSLPGGSTWTKVTAEFNSGSETYVYVGFMGAAAGATYTVDNVTMYKKGTTPDPEPEEPDEPATSEGLLNGDFESKGENWAFNSGSHAFVTDAHGGSYALQLTNPGTWAEGAVQTITVEPNTDYVITWWYKATTGTGTFNLFVMDGSTFANMTNKGGKAYMNNYTGAWTQGSYTVNTGSSTTMMLKWSTEASNPGTVLIDDIVVEKAAAHTHSYTSSVTKQPTCGATGIRTYTCSCGNSYTETIAATGAHKYDNACDTSCNVCGATRTVSHQYSGACDNYCNLCGAKKTGFVIGAQHTYDNACDADCNVCGEIRSVSGHSYTATVTKPATCGTSGIKTYTCSACGDSYTETIAATGAHTYDNACDADCNVCGATRTTSHSYKAVVTAPDCVNGGYTTYTCTVCGDSYKDNYTAALGHKYDNDCDTDCNVCGATRTTSHSYKAVVTDPTCEVGGYTTYTCTVCGDSYTETIPALGHSYNDVVIAPDCENSGYTIHTCDKCGDSYADGRVEALGHNYQVIESTSPTCVDDGEKVYGCGNCGHSYTEVLPAHGQHTYEWQCDEDCDVCGYIRNDAHSYTPMGTVEPTCGEDGWDAYKCWNCGKVDYVTIPATGNHTYSGVCDAECNGCDFVRDSVDAHNYVLTDSVELTCVTDGVDTYTCSSCGDSYTETTVAVGHKYGIVITAPDCENGGYTTHTCKACGDVIIDNRTDALGHAYAESARTEATCGADGSVTYTCGNCSDSYNVAIPATGEHVYFDDCSAICEACGYQREVSHNVIHVEAKSATCVANGNVEYWYCDACGMAWLDEACTLNTNLRAVKLPATGEHTYADEFDADCDVCGAIRELVASEAIIRFVGNSVTEENLTGAGLAFKFDLTIEDMAVENGCYAIYDNAKLNGYKLISMGAVVTNGVDTRDIPAAKLCDLEGDEVSFAVRIIKIPTDKLDVAVTATPYIVVEIDGVETTIYGTAQTNSYNSANN